MEATFLFQIAKSSNGNKFAYSRDNGKLFCNGQEIGLEHANRSHVKHLFQTKKLSGPFSQMTVKQALLATKM